VLAAAAGRPVVLELKPTPLPRDRTVAVLAERLRGLAAAGLPMAVTVSSRDADLVRAVRAAVPAPVRTALLGLPGQAPLAVLRQALAAGHDEVHPYVDDLLQQPDAVAAAGARGVAVLPWTVNSARALRRCAELGVAAVITDVPNTARPATSARRAAA
jgi:glycerophosphoryl diester phosphodiesterase